MIRLIFPILALAGAEGLPSAEAPISLLASHGPLSSSPRDDRDKSVVFLGGVLTSEDENTYRRLINTGGDPGGIAGPERIHYGAAEEKSLTQVKTVFSQIGFHVNDPSLFRPLNSKTIYMYFARGRNQAAETCRKKEQLLRSCAGYHATREIGLATSEDEGRTWAFSHVVVSAKDSGDGSGPGQPAALYVGDEVWLYYSTTNESFAKENLFRLRLSLDGRKRLGEPEPVKLLNFTVGTNLENVQLVRLKCEEGGKFVVTLVANNRGMTALPMFLSGDGLSFKPASESLVPHTGGNLVSPTQMPGPASAEECGAMKLSGVLTFRELLYSELTPAGWQLRRARLRLALP